MGEHALVRERLPSGNRHNSKHTAEISNEKLGSKDCPMNPAPHGANAGVLSSSPRLSRVVRYGLTKVPSVVQAVNSTVTRIKGTSSKSRSRRAVPSVVPPSIRC